MQEQLVTALSQQLEASTSQAARTNPENGWYQTPVMWEPFFALLGPMLFRVGILHHASTVFWAFWSLLLRRCALVWSLRAGRLLLLPLTPLHPTWATLWWC